jgi:hypothetical protein
MDPYRSRSVYTRTRMDWTCILSSDPDHRQARAASSVGFACRRHPVGFDDKQSAATLAACASVGGNDHAWDAGDRCTGDRGGSRRSFNRHEALSDAYARRQQRRLFARENPGLRRNPQLQPALLRLSTILPVQAANVELEYSPTPASGWLQRLVRPRAT